MRPAIAALARALLAALLIFAAAGVQAQQTERSTVGGRFILMDHRGRIVTDQDFLGRYQLIFFGYTYCPDICPTSLQTVSDALDLLGAKSAQIVPLFVTVDPARDTAPVLADYVENFHPSMVGLTGSAEAVAHAARLYKIKYAKVQEKDADADDYLVDHSAGVYLMSPEGSFLAKFLHGIAPEKMAQRLEREIR